MQVLFDNMPSSIEHIKAGKTARARRDHRQRAPAFPDVPTVAETVPGYEASAWFGIGAPRRARRRRSSTISTRQIEPALADPKMKAKLADLGGVPMGGTPADFGKIIVSETAKWKKVVEFSGASVD